MKFFLKCWLIVCFLLGPAPLLASCYRTTTYVKPAYVAPTYYPPAVTVFQLHLFSVGPGYVPPPPPAAVVPVAAPVATCDQKIAALEARFAKLAEENAALRQRATAPVPQAAPKVPNLDWLTGANGCAACHGGAEPVKGIDYSKGVESLSSTVLLKTIRQINAKQMPPQEEAAYTKRGLTGPHPPVTEEQKKALDAKLEQLAQ